MPILITLVTLAALAGGFWAIARRFSHEELSFWTLLGVVFVARMASRLSTHVLSGADDFTKLAAGLGCYIAVLWLGLCALGKIRMLPALLLSIGFAVVAFVVSMILVMFIIPAGGRTP
ncbi:MAG: hypothetical protein KF678_06185 [Phycisphaeraceae bacterium]|nr:hypothetical protein [Phycisphaeraceae bacterium]